MIRRSGITILSAFLIAACGGGGGGGSNTTTPPPPTSTPPPSTPPTLAITAGNAQSVSKTSYQLTLQTASLANVGRQSAFIIDPPSTAASGSGYAKTVFQPDLSKPVVLGMQKIPFGPEVLPCTVSGSLTVSGDLAELQKLTAGDQVSIVADNCSDEQGESLNGSIDFVADEYDDIGSGLFRLRMRIDLTDFTFTSAQDTLAANGDVSVDVDTTGLPTTSETVSGNSLTIVANGNTESLSDYSTTLVVMGPDLNTSPYTVATSGTLDSSEAGTVLTYSTPVIFERTATDTYPSSGELLITAADNSSTRLIALPNAMVRIDVDTDGDGNVDESISATWEDFLG